jgi:hypothetical protein
VEADGRKQVYVEADGKVRLQPVDLGVTIGDQIEVQGLATGTRVVIRPPEGLVSGRAVTEEEK